MSESTFEIGQVFSGKYPPEAAAWCNENNAYLEVLKPKGKVRRFKIMSIPEPTRAEVINARIAELQAYLNSTDWYVIRYADTGQAIPVDVRADRQEARAEIDALRVELAGLV